MFSFCLLWIIKVCRRSRKTLLFLFCLYCIIIIILSSALSSDNSVIFHPISLKFSLKLVLDEETKWYQSSKGSGQGVVPKFYYAL